MLYTLLSLVVLLAAQAAAPAPSKAAQSPPPTKASPHQPVTVGGAVYEIGATDILGIKVFGEDALSNNYTVDSDGSITFPLVGRVQVAGKTTRQIEEHLVKLLDGDYLKRPQISVEIAQFRSRSIFVLGEVKNPGRYTIQGPQTLLEVIAHAGSTTPTASNTIIVQRYKEGIATAVSTAALPGDPRAAEVLRVSLDDLREGKLNANIILQDSDTIIVPPAERFYVTGFVKQPGSFVLRSNMTVRQAIAEAGGITERGSNRRIKIVRKVGDKEVEVDADMSDLVKPNDTIRVPARLI
jgi:polysaccharide export outer membrane protein